MSGVVGLQGVQEVASTSHVCSGFVCAPSHSQTPWSWNSLKAWPRKHATTHLACRNPVPCKRGRSVSRKVHRTVCLLLDFGNVPSDDFSLMPDSSANRREDAWTSNDPMGLASRSNSRREKSVRSANLDNKTNIDKGANLEGLLIGLGRASPEEIKGVEGEISLSKTLEDGGPTSLKIQVQREPSAPSSAAKGEEIRLLQGEMLSALKEWRERGEDAGIILSKLRKLGGLPTQVAYSRHVVQLCLRQQKLTAAIRLYEDLEGQGGLQLDQDAMQVLVVSAAKAGRGTFGVDVLEKMLSYGYRPRVATWSAVVSTLSRSAQSAELALDVFHRMREVAAAEGDTPPGRAMCADTGAFNAALNALSVLRRVRDAELLLEEMEQGQVGPDVQSYNILVKGYGMVGDLDRMIEVIEKMEAEGRSPGIDTWNTVVAARVGLGEIDLAKDVVRQLRDGERGSLRPNVRTYTILIKGYISVGRMGDAVRLLRAMEDEGALGGGVSPNEVSYGTIVDGLVNQGQLEEAKALVAEAASVGVQTTTLAMNALLKGYCRSGRMAEATALVHKMQRSGIAPDAVTYNTLVDGWLRHGSARDTARVLRRMRSQGLVPSAECYTSLIQAFGRHGQPDMAIRTFENMLNDPDVTVDRPAWNALIDSLCRCGRLSEAKAVFQEFKATGMEPSMPTYGALIRGFARAGKIGDALAVWREVEQKSEQLSSQPAVWRKGERDCRPVVVDERVLDALVDACVRAGYFARAMEFVARMERSGAPANKLKYKRLFVELHSNLYTSDNASQRRLDRTADRRKAVEAFKFWLGLPNSRYERDWKGWR